MMTTTPPRTFEQWLDMLVLAEPSDRLDLAQAGIDAGLALRRVQCTRHKTSLNWTSAFAHLDRTEAHHRLAEGTGTRLHQPGDLVAGLDPRTTSTCRKCRKPIQWAQTSTGGTVAVDILPNPTGTVVLAAMSDAPGEKPLALFLTTDEDRHRQAADAVHTLHQQTCRPRRGRR